MSVDKIQILIDETGCERDEAELALVLANYDVARAAKEVSRLFRDIAVLKVRISDAEASLYGLVIGLFNLRRFRPIRVRAIISQNPVVCMTSAHGNWYEFEKHLYAGRLQDGVLQEKSQELERALDRLWRTVESVSIYSELKSEASELTQGVFKAQFSRFFKTVNPRFEFSNGLLDRREVSALDAEVDTPAPSKAEVAVQNLKLDVELETDAAGSAAAELEPGDLVFARIVDRRDIAKYLARVFGGRTDDGDVPLGRHVESADRVGDAMRVRLRFSLGVTGEVDVPLETRLKRLKPSEIEAQGKPRPAGVG